MIWFESPKKMKTGAKMCTVICLYRNDDFVIMEGNVCILSRGNVFVYCRKCAVCHHALIVCVFNIHRVLVID